MKRPTRDPAVEPPPVPGAEAPATQDRPAGARYALALALVVASLGAFHGAWFARDHRIAFWDQLRYYAMTHDAVRVARGEHPDGAARLLDLHPSHPPLYGLAGAVPVILAGGGFETARLVNVGLAALTVLLTWALARRWMRPGAAVLAGALAGWAPLASTFTHLYYSENLLAPWVLLSLLLLERSDGLRRPGWTIALGAALGLGCLVKWTYPLFLAGPVLIAAAAGRRLRPLLVLALCALVVAGPWYGLHAARIAAFFEQGVTSGPQAQLSAHRGLAGLLFYPKEIVFVGLGIPLALAAAAGSALALRHRPGRASALLGVAVLPLLVLTFALTKKERHLLPALPVAAILAGFAVDRLRGRPARLAAGAALAAHAVLASFQASFGAPDLGRVTVGPARVPLLSVPSPPGLPDPVRWPYEPLLDAIAAGSDPGRPPRVMVAFNLVPFREDGLLHHALERDLRLDSAITPFHFPVGDPNHRPFPLEELRRTEWLLVKSGTAWVRFASGVPVHRNACRIIEEVMTPGTGLAAAFDVVRRVPLPDGSVAELRRPSSDPARERRLALFALRWEDDHEGAWRILGEPMPADASARRRRLAGLGALPPVLAGAPAEPEAEAVALRDAIAGSRDREDLWQSLAAAAPEDAVARRYLALREDYRLQPPAAATALALAEMADPRTWVRRACEADMPRALTTLREAVAKGLIPLPDLAPEAGPDAVVQALRAAER